MASIIELSGRKNRWKFSSLGGRMVGWRALDGEEWRRVCKGKGTRRASEDAHRSAVMFPWVNRIGGASWSLGPVEVPIDRSGPLTHLHGLTADMMWEIVEQTATRVEFHFAMPAQKFYPRRVDASVAYEIVGKGSAEALEVSIVARNPSEKPDDTVYVTTGIHPYFLNPFGGTVDRMELFCAADRHFALDEALIPEALIEPAGDADFRKPRKIGDVNLDNGYTLLADAVPAVTLRLNHFEFALEPVEDCGFVQIYIPPGREEIAIEPQSGGPDAFHVHEYGLWKLGPGEERAFRVRMGARFE